KPRGDENTRPGFDTKTPGAFLNRACSGPEGASAASQSPLTAIFDTKSIPYNVKLVFSCIKCCIKKLV
ncbi:hypothetical protein DKI96_18020, partial [Salmonella enterica subsp. enterica serovar Corvallis]|nr:hypothetical protein [Salmonella enterica subsp. enterica serovar Corvallis]